MEFSVKSGNPEKQRTACIVMAVLEPRRLSGLTEHLDKVSNGFLTNLVKRGDLEGKIDQSLLLFNVPNTLADRILLIGCGPERELNDSKYRTIITNTIKLLSDTGSKEAICYLTELNIKGRDLYWKVRQGVEAVRDGLYRFDMLKSKKNDFRRPLKKITFTIPNRRELPNGEKAVREGLAISNGVQLAKNLGNLPGNICTPSYLVDQAKSLARRFKHIKVTVLEPKQMEKMGMGALLSVSRGSREPAKLITLEYSGAKNLTPSPNDKLQPVKPVVLVGKGLTFDAGGISLKPSANMDEMKFDMCGAASVLGTLRVIAELELAINLIGVIPSSENLPDGAANKPGDVVTSLSGQTIEILNTDAEGRLLLCDALTYSARYNPSVVIDIATLTGACVVALGKHASGLLGNHQPLIHDLLRAGRDSSDRAWELPLWEDYQEQLKSNFADMANIGGKGAGTITAACFLSRFTKKFHWAHLDIAGTAWKTGTEKGATGRPVPLLSQYLLHRVNLNK